MSDPLLEAQNLSVRYQLPQPIGDWLLRRQRYVDAVIDANFTLSEGQTLAIQPDSVVVLSGLLASLLLGLFASLWPAWRAMRQPIVESLKG